MVVLAGDGEIDLELMTAGDCAESTIGSTTTGGVPLLPLSSYSLRLIDADGTADDDVRKPACPLGVDEAVARWD